MSDSPEDYGTTIAGSRWFDGDPDVTSEQMVPVRKRWWCPMDGCSGEMRFNGSTWPMNPPGYHHTCDSCGFTAALRGERYPRAEFISADEAARSAVEAGLERELGEDQ